MIIEVQDQLRHYSLENGEAYAVALTAKGLSLIHILWKPLKQ